MTNPPRAQAGTASSPWIPARYSGARTIPCSSETLSGTRRRLATQPQSNQQGLPRLPPTAPAAWKRLPRDQAATAVGPTASTSLRKAAHQVGVTDLGTRGTPLAVQTGTADADGRFRVQPHPARPGQRLPASTPGDGRLRQRSTLRQAVDAGGRAHGIKRAPCDNANAGKRLCRSTDLLRTSRVENWELHSAKERVKGRHGIIRVKPHEKQEAHPVPDSQTSRGGNATSIAATATSG